MLFEIKNTAQSTFLMKRNLAKYHLQQKLNEFRRSRSYLNTARRNTTTLVQNDHSKRDSFLEVPLPYRRLSPIPQKPTAPNVNKMERSTNSTTSTTPRSTVRASIFFKEKILIGTKLFKRKVN